MERCNFGRVAFHCRRNKEIVVDVCVDGRAFSGLEFVGRQCPIIDVAVASGKRRTAARGQII
jgi:hypothetical protein